MFVSGRGYVCVRSLSLDCFVLSWLKDFPTISYIDSHFTKQSIFSFESNPTSDLTKEMYFGFQVSFGDSYLRSLEGCVSLLKKIHNEIIHHT